MLYALLLSMCRWLEYCTCYCLVTSQVNLEDPVDGEYQQLANDILDSAQELYEIVFTKNDGDGKNYDCFI